MTKNENIKVSIVIPIYNGGKYLGACLDSVLKQTIDSYEVICVNDGSTDETYSILEKYKEKNADILKVFHIENGGVWRAREFGIKQAQGEYVGFCDCDDVVKETMCENMYRNVKNNDAQMAVCSFVRIKNNKVGKPEMCGWGNKTICMKEHKEQFAVINTALWNKLIRRDIVTRHIKFTNPPRVAEDMMFLLSLYPFIERISFLDTPYYYYYARENTAMTYFNIEEIRVLEQDMYLTQKKVMRETKEQLEWVDVIQLFVMIHMGLSLVLRCKEQETKKCIRHVYEYLENNVPNWKRNSYLRIPCARGLLKVKVINFFYETRMIYMVGRWNYIFLKLIKW